MALGRPLAGSAELALHLGDVAVALADGGSGNSFTWNEVDLDWAGGETVAVRLAKESDGEVETPSGAAVSVADAQAREAAGAMLAFRVRLHGRCNPLSPGRTYCPAHCRREAHAALRSRPRCFPRTADQGSIPKAD